jgi:hypothetical protein
VAGKQQEQPPLDARQSEAGSLPGLGGERIKRIPDLDGQQVVGRVRCARMRMVTPSVVS